MTDQFPGFARCLGMIRQGAATRDAMMHEHGYFWLIDRAPEYVAELLTALDAEEHPFVKVTLIELLGATLSTEVIPALTAQLNDPYRDVRMYSVLSLEELGFPEALRLAEDYKARHPDEF